MIDLKKLLQDHAADAIDEWELFWRICQVASEQPPEAIAKVLNPDWLPSIEDACTQLSEEFSESEWLANDPKWSLEEGRRIWDGLAQWRRYFAERRPNHH
jgi:hypothetical protein